MSKIQSELLLLTKVSEKDAAGLSRKDLHKTVFDRFNDQTIVLDDEVKKMSAEAYNWCEKADEAVKKGEPIPEFADYVAGAEVPTRRLRRAEPEKVEPKKEDPKPEAAKITPAEAANADAVSDIKEIKANECEVGKAYVIETAAGIVDVTCQQKTRSVVVFIDEAKTQYKLKGDTLVTVGEEETIPNSAIVPEKVLEPQKPETAAEPTRRIKKAEPAKVEPEKTPANLEPLTFDLKARIIDIMSDEINIASGELQKRLKEEGYTGEKGPVYNYFYTIRDSIHAYVAKQKK